MGLDISYYGRLERGETPADGEYGYPDVFQPFINPSFPGRAAGIEPDVWYKRDEAGDFRAGSYSGYGAWRAALASVAEGAFWELINFSDCEGTIGPVVSAKLAKDFETHRDRIQDEVRDEYFMHLYDAWMKAFQTAADGGCVTFH